MLNLTSLLSLKNDFRESTKKNPPVIVWNLTKSCNLNCSFCYYDARIKIGTETIFQNNSTNFNLSTEIIKQLKEAQIRFVLFSGGEPLLYPEIFDLISSLAPSIKVGISTNGTLINKGVARKLKNAGANYVGVSIDGLKHTHNRLRRSPSAFDQALNGLKYSKSAGLKTGIRLTLNRFNYNELVEFFKFSEGLKVDRLCFYHLVYSGRAGEASNDLSIAQRRNAIKLIIKLTAEWIKRKIPTDVLTVDNFSDAVVILDYIQKENPRFYSDVLKSLKKQSGCPAGKRILSIDHQGILHPCQFWQSYKLGDLRRENLSDILGDGRLFNEWKVKLKGRCAECDYKDICGGCRVRAYQRYGDFWQEDPSCEVDILEHN